LGEKEFVFWCGHDFEHERRCVGPDWARVAHASCHNVPTIGILNYEYRFGDPFVFDAPSGKVVHDFVVLESGITVEVISLGHVEVEHRVVTSFECGEPLVYQTCEFMRGGCRGLSSCLSRGCGWVGELLFSGIEIGLNRSKVRLGDFELLSKG